MGLGHQQGAQGEGVVDGAEHVLGALAAQPDGRGAGGDDQAVVLQLALCGLERALAQALGRHAGAQVDVEGAEIGVDDRGVQLAEQHGLRQGWTIIGAMVLVSDQSDAPSVTARPQRFDTPHAGQPGSDHHDMIHNLTLSGQPGNSPTAIW